MCQKTPNLLNHSFNITPIATFGRKNVDVFGLNKIFWEINCRHWRKHLLQNSSKQHVEKIYLDKNFPKTLPVARMLIF